MFCAEKGIPGAYLPSPNTGGGGPITMAGALALGNAECLAGLLLTQLVRPGCAIPVRHELWPPSTCNPPSSPTARPTGLRPWRPSATWPVSTTCRSGAAPAPPTARSCDAQAGFEATSTIMSAFMSRCNVVHDVGYMEYGSTSSMELLVICDEIIRHTRFIVDGVEVSERTLARGDPSGAAGRRLLRGRPHAGELEGGPVAAAGRRPPALWQLAEAGQQGHGGARERMGRRILDEHQVPPLLRLRRRRLPTCCAGARQPEIGLVLLSSCNSQGLHHKDIKTDAHKDRSSVSLVPLCLRGEQVASGCSV